MRPAVVFGQLHAGLALTRALGRDGVPVHGVAFGEREFGLRSRYLLSRMVARSDENVLELLRGLPERPVLFPERDENVAFVLRILAVSSREQKRRAFAALKSVGLHHKMHAYPLQLSGGEQQRVAIARALINEPMLLLADEPTGNLDPDMAQEIMSLFQEVNARGTTVLVATHDREMIQRMRNRVIALDRGRVVAG